MESVESALYLLIGIGVALMVVGLIVMRLQKNKSPGARGQPRAFRTHPQGIDPSWMEALGYLRMRAKRGRTVREQTEEFPRCNR